MDALLNLMHSWFRAMGLPEIATAHGQQLDDMNAYIHWMMMVLFVGWGIFFLYTLFKFSARRNKQANYHGVTNHRSTYAEVGVVVAEAALLFALAIPLWGQRVNEFPAEQDAVVVRVVAQQFTWNNHYAGKDGKFGRTKPELVNEQSNPIGLDRKDPAALDDITNVNQMHIPVDKPAILYLSSKDVIHSFGVPEFRVKQDAIPGLNTPMWFTPTVTTEEMRKRKNNPKFNYEIACAQLCGVGHAKMRGFVTVHSAEGFQQWLDQQEPTLAGGEEDEFWG